MFWLVVATLCASFVKGLCGFANTLVFTTILSFTVDNVNISPVELVASYPSNLIITIRERKSIDWKVCLPLAALVLLGNIPGIFMLKNVNSQIVKIIFGFVIVIMGIEMFLRQRMTQKSKQSPIVLGMIGVLSGVLCGLYGVGALLAAYVDRVTEDSHAFKANLCFVFMIECTFRVVVYSLTGILTWETFRQGMMMVPLMVVGVLAGMKSGSFLDEKIVKKLVIVVLIISGIALILNNC